MWVWNDFITAQRVPLLAGEAHHRAAGVHGGRRVPDRLAVVHDPQRARPAPDGACSSSFTQRHIVAACSPEGASRDEPHGRGPLPLYTDPVHHAPTDPVVVEAPDGTWWMFYTQRRAGGPLGGVAWVHGTDIGVAPLRRRRPDLDVRRRRRRSRPPTRAATRCGRRRSSASASEYHMFLTHVPGTPDSWDGHREHHCTTRRRDLATGRTAARCRCPPTGSSTRASCAARWRLPTLVQGRGAGSRAWSRRLAGPSHVDRRRPVDRRPPGEGANVFRLGEWWWMLIDEWRGRRSTDRATWRIGSGTGRILDERSADRGVGHHADVVVGRDENGLEVGWIFYFTHRIEPAPSTPGRPAPADRRPRRRTACRR